MGTNFYAIKYEDVACEECGHHIEERKHEHHLGKRSSGWPFTFYEGRHALVVRGDCVPTTANLILSKLTEDGWLIYDEFNQFYTVWEFALEVGKYRGEFCDDISGADLGPGTRQDGAGDLFSIHEFS